MHFLIPAALDLDAHLQAFPPPFASFHRDELVRLLDLITKVPARSRRLAEKVRQQQGFVPISATMAQEVVHDYKQYLAYAVNTGLLSSDNRWSPKAKGNQGKCTGYRFGELFGSAEDVLTLPMQVVALTDPRIQRKAERLRAHHRARVPKKHKKNPKEYARQQKQRIQSHQHVLHWLSVGRTPLRIDEEAALVHIEARRRHLQAHPEERAVKRHKWSWKRRWVKKADREMYVDPNEQYVQRQRSILHLVDQDLHPRVDDNVGRMHTTLTNMSKELRPFVYAEGQGQLVAIDLKNSQPYLANMLLNIFFYTKGGGRKSTKKGENTTISSSLKSGSSTTETLGLSTSSTSRTSATSTSSGRTSKTPSGEESIGTLFYYGLGKGLRKEIMKNNTMKGTHLDVMLVKTIQDTDNEDIAKYKELTSSGGFYEGLADALQDRGYGGQLDRDSLKEMVFQVLFTKSGFTSAGKRTFRELFPTVDRIFAMYQKGDNSILPRFLQMIEAHLFLHVIGKRVHRELPEIPFFTVHDSLVVPVEYADQVQEIMDAELTRYVGVPPTLSRELWGEKVQVYQYPYRIELRSVTHDMDI